jgi:hypothetical protein
VTTPKVIRRPSHIAKGTLYRTPLGHLCYLDTWIFDAGGGGAWLAFKYVNVDGRLADGFNLMRSNAHILQLAGDRSDAPAR